MDCTEARRYIVAQAMLAPYSRETLHEEQAQQLTRD